MHTITFTCETITPMFLSGADGQTPELRPPSIKGALRFWWRAMNGHLAKERLREEEENLFGGTGVTTQRSSLIIRMPYIGQPLSVRSDILVPHKEFMKKDAIQPGQLFKVVLQYREEPKEGYFKALFILTGILGGLGKRSRRGMGCWQVKEINGQKFEMPSSLSDIYAYMSVITQYYRCDSKGIFCTYSGNMEKYPWISSIEFSGKPKSLKIISQRTHDVKGKYGAKYEGSMGHASRGRFGSPVYVSMLRINGGDVPIITTLNAIPDKRELNVDISVQRDFKDGLL